MTDRPTVVAPEAQTDVGAIVDDQPAGERYFRHPGDVVRLVVWVVTAVALALFVEVATATSAGISSDLGAAASHISRAVRELLLAITQLLALAIPVLVIVLLLYERRFRRLGVVVLAAIAGAAAAVLADAWLDLSGRVDGAVTGGTWIADARFPSVTYLAGAAAVVATGKPWLNRSWRRAADVSIGVLTLVLAVVGMAGLPELLLGAALGTAAGAAVLVALGAPNRRASPAMVVQGLGDAGLEVSALSLQRAEGGRAQLYRATTVDGRGVFVKVYGRDSRDADLLYRGYRTLVLRGTTDWSPPGLARGVEHEALLVLLAQRAGVSSPAVEALTTLPDGSVALAVELVHGPRLDELAIADITPQLLDSLWRQVAMLHVARLAHRSLRARERPRRRGTSGHHRFGVRSRVSRRTPPGDRPGRAARVARITRRRPNRDLVGRDGDRARCACRRAPIPATARAVVRDALRGEQAGPR